jgi:crotonobetainyl-CoA:carnitine CoA-transferase CaiB-like acyl-CoA transferase
VPAVPVVTAEDRLRAAGLVERLVRLPGDGPPVKGFPLRFVGYAVPIHRHAPVIGEDTLDVLTGLLGRSPDEVDRLRAEGVVYVPPRGDDLASTHLVNSVGSI